MNCTSNEDTKNKALAIVERWKPILAKRIWRFLNVGMCWQIVTNERDRSTLWRLIRSENDYKFPFEVCFREEIADAGGRVPWEDRTVYELRKLIDIEEAVYNTLVCVSTNTCSCRETCLPVRAALLEACELPLYGLSPENNGLMRLYLNETRTRLPPIPITL